MAYHTLYASIDEQLASKLKKIKLLVCDVDGVFSDGNIYLGNSGEELKAFNTKDGYGIKALISTGIDVAVITGRRSHIVEQRMNSLNVAHLIQGEVQKKSALERLIAKLGLQQDEIASFGDDIPDTGMFELSAIKIAVFDAHPLVKKQANWVTTLKGGKGAVREVCDTIMQVNNTLSGIQASST